MNLLRSRDVETGFAERSWSSCRILKGACCCRLARSLPRGNHPLSTLGSLRSLSKLHDWSQGLGNAWLERDWKATMLSAASAGQQATQEWLPNFFASSEALTSTLKNCLVRLWNEKEGDLLSKVRICFTIIVSFKCFQKVNDEFEFSR